MAEMNDRVPAFDIEGYTVDRSGNVYRRDGQLKYLQLHRGYLCFCIGDANRKHMVHRIIWQSFNGPIPDGYVIDHIDRDRVNNAINNLRLATRSENRQNATKRCDGKHSRYIGVIDAGGKLRGTGTRYRARVKKNGKAHYSAVFRCETAAAISRDMIAINLFGRDTVSLNFPGMFGRSDPSAAGVHPPIVGPC